MFGLPKWVWLVAIVMLYLASKRMKDDAPCGRVVGIVGRMGSGKSYMATRLAYRRMWRGAKIVTNFSMYLQCPKKGHRRYHCPCKLASQWVQFNDWPDLLSMSNCVVIIDEADLYAPSHDYHAITDEVRWKLKMARKHKIDVYWIAQHESRVNRILRDVLTNEIAICHAYFGGFYFTAKFYDPSTVRKPKAHVARVGYWLNRRIARLYNTLETITGSEYAGDETMGNVNELVRQFNEKAWKDPDAPEHTEPTRPRKRNKPCDHERRNKKKAGTCMREECQQILDTPPPPVVRAMFADVDSD